MNIEAFRKLQEFDTTSWAIWSEREDCSVEFFKDRLDVLHGRVVFLGLNRSEAWPHHIALTHMPNFHTAGHVGDRRLSRFIQDANLQNLVDGFMTDLSDEIRTRSDFVNIDIQEALPILIQKLALTEQAPLRHMICFGDKVFNTLRKGLSVKSRSVSYDAETKTKQYEANVKDERWNVYRIWHPGNYGLYLHKSEVELPRQLTYINGQIA